MTSRTSRIASTLPALLVAAAVLAAVLFPARPLAGLAADETVAVRGGRLYTGSGGIFDPGLVIIRAGRILSAGPMAAVPADARIIDATGSVIVPGLIDAFTTLTQGSLDDEESIAADVQARDAFDLFGSYRAQLSGGVTTVYVTPGLRRLVNGQGTVVKLAGSDDDRTRRVLRDRASLRIALGEAPKNPPNLFDPPVPPSSENPILPARRQLPTTRIGAIAALRQALDEAREYEAKRKTGAPRRDLKIEPFVRLLAGEVPARINAHKVADILAALSLSEEYAFPLVIEGGTEAHLVAAEIAKRQIPVVLSGLVRPSERAPEGGSEEAGEGTEVVENAAVLERAGVTLAIHSTGRLSQPDLLLLAGYAVRGGLSPDAALRAVTRDAAAVLGVGSRVGSLDPGKDGDLVILTGDPFDARSTVRRVLVEGKTVYEAPEANGTLAIRCGRLLTGAGLDSPPTLRNAVVLIEGGKIVEVGEGVSIPPGARIVDARSSVVTPGFIDVNSHLGLSVEMSPKNRLPFRIGEIQAGGSGSLKASLAVVPGDPTFGPAREAGVTTILLGPGLLSPVNGQAALLKLSGDTISEMLVRDPAALTFGATAQALGRNRLTHVDALRATLKAGKDYHEKWEKYQKDLKEWEEKQKAQAAADRKAEDEAKKKAAVEGAEKAEKTEKADEKKPEEKKLVPVDPITGKWEATITAQIIPEPVAATLELRLSGSTVTGTITSRMAGVQEIPAGTWDGRTLAFAIDSPQGRFEVRMSLEEEHHLRGEWTVQGMITGQIDARRVEFPTKEGGTGGSGPAKKESGKPEEPKTDDNLEPFRALFRKECVAAVHATRADEILNALRVFKDEYGLDGFIVQGDDAWRIADEIKKRGWGVAVGPVMIAREEGEVRNNAQILARSGVTVAFQTDSASGTRFLPVNASYAVRYGLSATEALRALTSGAARCLKLEDRIGSIQAGRDADLVIWSGDPFDLSSKVEKVIVSGRVVFEASP